MIFENYIFNAMAIECNCGDKVVVYFLQVFTLHGEIKFRRKNIYILKNNLERILQHIFIIDIQA